jgi:tetratricopeptide (TPR) repeat protein
MPSISDALMIAIRHQQGGRFQTAAEIYRQILAVEPNHVEALHLLGMAAYQSGNHDEAAASWQRAVELQPDFAQAHYNLGLVCKGRGKLEQAIACWRRALELQPDVASTHNNLGNALSEQGQLDAAIACYRRALELQPDYAQAHYNLGNACKDQQRLDEAAASYRRALQVQPDYTEALNNLADVVRRQGQFELAISYWRRTVELKPDFAEAHYNLSVVNTDLGHFEEAIASSRRTLALKPDYAEAHNNLGNALRELGDLDGAVAACRRAMELKPELAEAHNNLGNALKDLGKYDEALARYRRALDLRPDFAQAHYNLGSALEHAGDLSGAEESFRSALGFNSRYALAYYNLDVLLGGKLPENDLAAQRRLLGEGHLADSERMLLHFGLAQVLDARGEYAAAAADMELGNSLQRAELRSRGREYDPRQHESLVSRLIEASTPHFFRTVGDFGSESSIPVFVMGLPRSGTTLIEQILASHSQVFGAGEIHLGHETFTALGGPNGDFLAGLRALDRQTARRLASRHLERLRELDRTALCIVDKQPENYLYLGMLAVLFPRARFVHCRRDLRDVALSCWMTHFQEVRWASEPQHIVSRLHEYMRIMDHWRHVLPVPLLELDYEDTVADLEGVARRLVGWCGLEWEDRCLEFHKTKRPITTASAVQVRQPVYGTSVGKWRRYEPYLASLFAQISQFAVR